MVAVQAAAAGGPATQGPLVGSLVSLAVRAVTVINTMAVAAAVWLLALRARESRLTLGLCTLVVMAVTELHVAFLVTDLVAAV